MSMESGFNRERWIRSVLERHEGSLLRYVRGIVGEIEIARDIVQDAFLKLCMEKPEKVRDKIPAWLYAVCRNRAIDLLRKEKRMNPLEESALATLEAHEPSPAQALQRRETDSRIQQAISALPGRQQEAIRLKFQEGLSYREISEITGDSSSNVGFLIHSGMKTLRERLASLDAEVSGGKPC